MSNETVSLKKRIKFLEGKLDCANHIKQSSNDIDYIDGYGEQFSEYENVTAKTCGTSSRRYSPF